MIVGIDPSFSGTGLACVLKGKVYKTLKVKSQGGVYKNVTTLFSLCDEISENVLAFIQTLMADYPEEQVNVIVEYPALQTPSGAYLAVLMGKLYSCLTALPLNVLYYIPPMACDAFTGNRQHKKSFLVDYCLKRNLISKKLSHDECTAIIFCLIFSNIVKKKYQKSYFKVNLNKPNLS